MSYNTKQQQAILRCLQQRPEQAFTAADLSVVLRRQGCAVGLATVYRQLDRLEQMGCVHKVATEEGALYQYCPHQESRQACFLLRCEGCGRILHLDCRHLQALSQHLTQAHGFYMDPRRTVLTGLCQACARERGEEAPHDPA